MVGVGATRRRRPDNTEFYGSWGTYPYFGDGKVVVNSSDEGLFVLDSRAKSSDNGPKRKGAGSSAR